MMDMQQLRIFLSISRTLNFTRTAEEFFMTQPTVSNRVRALEEELGAALIQRSPHHVSLTEAGEEFVSYATSILELEAAAALRMRNLTADKPGYIRVAMLSSAAPQFSRALKEFSRRYPKVQVDVAMLEGSEMLRAISRLEYDLYFANEPMLPRSSGKLAYAVTGTSQLHLFVNRTDLPSIDMEDWRTIGKHPFVSMQASDFTLAAQIDRLCQNRGVKPEIMNYYNRADMLLLGVDSGAGVAILPPEVAALKCPENVISLPIPGEDATLRSVVAWKTDSRNAEADRFRDIALARTDGGFPGLFDAGGTGASPGGRLQ